MASGASGDSTTTASTTSTTTPSFFFRPSALSDVADKMWKKSSVEPTASATGNGNHSSLFSLPHLSTLGSSGGTTTNIFTTCSSAAPSSPFIFGKNISRRVAHATDDAGNSVTVESTTIQDNDNKSEMESSKEKHQTEDAAGKNIRTEVSFDTLAATSTNTTSLADANGATATTAATETAVAILEDAAATLEASAAAYEAAKHQTQKQPQLLAPEEVKTGEEDEMNVVKASVKLYVFDTTKQSWTDRGLAIIRVNDRRVTSDDGEVETRIVVRLQGSLRVIVNTKLWPDMLLERVSPKRLRLSGTVEDSIFSNAISEQNPGISIYLISASQSADVDRVERALRDRVARLKSVENRANSAVSKKRPYEHSNVASSFKESDQGESPAKKRELDEQGGD